MRVNLSSLPSAPKELVLDFPRLDGGLNLWELPYRLEPNQSPDVKNLWWQDGVLQCRDGQLRLGSLVAGEEVSSLGVGYACHGSMFWGHAFFHIGDALYSGVVGDYTVGLTKLIEGVPCVKGTFFRYGDWLFYKNKGGFFKISYHPDADTPFAASRVEDEAYTPVILINADPATCAGDLYQPENRLCARMTVRYNAVEGAVKYVLPVKEVDGVDAVKVDGAVLSVGTDYTVDLTAGAVTFKTAPPVTDPATNNTVEITFSKANPDAYSSIMDCCYAEQAGGDQNLCILLAGCAAQPNAVFWNSNDNLSMNCSYFPVTYYNLVSDTEDRVTGFGRQYSDLIVLKEHSVGKLTFGAESVDGRESISFAYANVNSKVGCDLPWSIQLIENNLVFCNTYQGVQILRAASAAYENNVECISRNVNGNESRGLLADIRAVTADTVVSFDDDDRYWLCANGHVYLWDYGLSTFSSPSWFYFTNVPGVAYFQDDNRRRFHMDISGRVTRFMRRFADYDGPIEKVYTFPTTFFGSYDRLKDVTSILLACRADTDTDITIRYDTDYETRFDLTPVRAYSWKLTPRNLLFRNLSVTRYASSVRRRPGCRHVRHFSMTFSNSIMGCDLAIVSAQIFYNFQGRER